MTTEKTSLSPHFSVQQHGSLGLYHELALEQDGILARWFIPKGFSMDPAARRLAALAEGHTSYEFEDYVSQLVSPSLATVWDEGLGEILGAADSVGKALADGRVEFALKGRRLKGRFVLVRLKRDEQNLWLLTKQPDKYAKLQGSDDYMS